MALVGAFGGIIMKRFLSAASAAGKNHIFGPKWGKIVEKTEKIGFDCRPHDFDLISTKLNHPCTFFPLSAQCAKEISGGLMSSKLSNWIFLSFSLCGFEGYLSCGYLITTLEMEGSLFFWWKKLVFVLSVFFERKHWQELNKINPEGKLQDDIEFFGTNFRIKS